MYRNDRYSDDSCVDDWYCNDLCGNDWYNNDWFGTAATRTARIGTATPTSYGIVYYYHSTDWWISVYVSNVYGSSEYSRTSGIYFMRFISFFSFLSFFTIPTTTDHTSRNHVNNDVTYGRTIPFVQPCDPMIGEIVMNICAIAQTDLLAGENTPGALIGRQRRQVRTTDRRRRGSSAGSRRWQQE